MTAISAAVLDCVHRDVEIFGQFTAQTGRIKCGQRRNLRGFQSRVQKNDKTGNIGRVEDDDDMFYVGAIFLDILSELFGNSRISFEQVFTSHAGLTGSATRVDDIFGTGEGFFDIGRIGDVHPFKTAMI